MIEEHESIIRCLRQVQMPRMSPNELNEIINQRLPTLWMSISKSTLEYVDRFIKTLPHYTHLIGQQAASKAINVPRRRRDVVELDTDTGFTHDDRFDYVSIHRALI